MTLDSQQQTRTDVDLLLFVLDAVLIGVPMLAAFLVGGVEWSVQIGTFAIALQLLKQRWYV